MENKGLNVFNTACVLAAPLTATDGDYDRVLGVVAHEYFHNWSGNRVTCRDWFQLTLKEGFTVFRDQTFTEDQTSKAVKRIDDVRVMRSAQFAQDAGPMAHPIRPESYVAMDNFYTVTVYNKGAEVIRMYSTLLGWAGFRKGSDLYFKRHDGQAVTCDDFRAAMSDANDVDLTQFERWYTQAGTPTVELSDKSVKDGAFSLTLTQSTSSTPGQASSEKQPFHIPVLCALFDKKTGKKLDEQLFELREAAQGFAFPCKVEGSPDDYVVSLLRGFSAPATARQALTRDELLFLARSDDDALNRWDAAQQLYGRAILDAFHGSADRGASLEAAVATFKAALDDTGGDPSLRALNMAVPGFSELGLQLEDGFDPVALCEALSSVKKALAAACVQELRAVYDSLESDAPYDVEAASVGRRRLRNACLGNLARAGGFEQASLKHYEEAQCMTDQLAGAVALAGEASAERDEVLGKFLKSAQDRKADLVINKWFALQASADSDDALDVAKKLVAHPAFSRSNPNCYRSVVNTFAGANPRAFHCADGEGYAFIRDEVIRTDKTNNQVAARLCGSFGTWKKYDAPRQALMKACLEAIVETEGLSKDTFEIATRSLK